MRLGRAFRLGSRFQSVFVRCSFQYHGRCGLQNDWREAGETEATPLHPCEKGYLFNCCIVVPLPLGVSDGGSLSPTGRLQRFLSERSASRGERAALRDVTIRFECVGTNESSSRLYMKSKVGPRGGAEAQSNRVLFAESLSLNSLLQLPSLRSCIRRHGSALADTPRLATGAGLRELAGRSAEEPRAAELGAASPRLEQPASFDLYRWARRPAGT